VASSQKLTHYQASSHRGYEGFQDAGILPNYKGNLIHDCFGSYFQTPAQHGLCNAHLLRELQRVEEQYRQGWATDMRALLRGAKIEVEASPHQKLSKTRIQELHHTFSTLLTQGKALNPAKPPLPTKKRGRTKQSFAYNLLARLDTYQDDILRFIKDPSVPFDNNLAERDLRMIKLKDKISGGARGQGAKFFARIRGYLSTLRKQSIPTLAALHSLFMGQPIWPRLC
jgi:transposase